MNYHKYLKKFFNWCVLNRYMKKNPILEIKKPKRPQRLPRRLTEDEARKILYTAFSHSWRYEYERSRNHAIIATLLYSGLRRNELLNLELMDVNLDTGILLIRQGKGGKDRYVPIHHKLKYVLKRYLTDRKIAKKESMYLFVSSQSNRPLTESGIKGIFQTLRKMTNIYFTPHQLRHTFGSVAVEQNVALPKVQQIMGHSDIQSTMIYVKMSSKALSAGLNAVELF
ncbi:tyrosine-type recombinase/integrase [Candidatus Peregrinibacteria bacterium]|nr:tyrosine-type recombinase/integrase [Candidatus Peregrinibacteria bacterium]